MQLKFMPQDGHFWKIEWLGDVRYPNRLIRQSMPSIAVELSLQKSCGRKNGPNGSTPHQTIYAPIGFLNKLRIGDIWRNGKLLESPDYTLEKLSNVIVRPTTTRIIKSGLSEQHEGNELFYLPLHHFWGHAKHTHSYCLLVDLADNRRLIIPAIELIRFYFGSSSSLLGKLFQFPLTPDKLWSRAIRGKGNQKAQITLAPGITGWSASDVARIAFDPVAWHTAQLVGNSLSAAKINRQPLYPKAHFPFDGKTTLQTSGVWLPLGNNPVSTFLVFKLLSCSHRFPFAGLEYQKMAALSIDRHGNKPANNMDSSAEALKGMVPAKKVGRTAVEQDPSRSLALATVKQWELSQFPDLKYKSIRSVEPLNGRESAMTMAAGKLVQAASVGEGGKIEDIRPIDLVRSVAQVPEISARSVLGDLLGELSRSEQIFSDGILEVGREYEIQIRERFEAFLKNNGNAHAKRLLPGDGCLTSVSIGMLSKGTLMAYVLIGEGRSRVAISSIGLVVKLGESDSFSEVEYIITELDKVNSLSRDDRLHGKFTYIIPVNINTMLSSYQNTLKKLSSQLRLYIGLFE